MKPTEPTTRPQFPIHRLFWMTMVAAVFLAVGNKVGLQSFASHLTSWYSGSGISQRAAMVSAIVVFLSILAAYYLWISFSLPHVFESLLALRRRRKKLRESLEQEIVERKRTSQNANYHSDDSA